jgi:NAD(P) transhydrogenase
VRKQQVLAAEHQEIRRSLHDLHVQIYRGHGSFLDAHTVQVKTADGQTCDLRGEFVLLATGSSPRRPAGFPFEDPDVVESDSILSLDRIPDTMTVVGGGVIGCEYASIFAALGVGVTLLEGRGEILGFLDAEITGVLREGMSRLGVKIILNDDVEKVIDEPARAWAW